MNSQLSTFWNLSADQIFVQVQSTPQGLAFILSLLPFFYEAVPNYLTIIFGIYFNI